MPTVSSTKSPSPQAVTEKKAKKSVVKKTTVKPLTPPASKPVAKTASQTVKVKKSAMDNKKLTTREAIIKKTIKRSLAVAPVKKTTKVSKSEESITQVATKKTTRKTVTTKQPSRVQKKDAAASKKSIPLVVPLKVSEVKPISHLAQPVIEKPSEGDHFSLSRFAETIVDGLAMNLGLEKKLLQWLLSDREKLTPTRLAHIDHFMRAAKIHPRVALDDYGTTPMMMAVDHRHRGLIELLQRML